MIGLVEKGGENGLPRVRLGSAATVVLEIDDILVVLGRDEHLDALETAVRDQVGSKTEEHDGLQADLSDAS